MKKGKCVICGEAGELTRDHVPPKGALPSDPVLVQALESFMSSDSPSARQPHKVFPSREFPTLCKRCNVERLGRQYDPALISLVIGVARWLRLSIEHDFSLPRKIEVSCQEAASARAVVGHLLAADEDPDRSLAGRDRVAQAMCDFFLDDQALPPPNLHVSLWPYPGTQQVLIRQFCISTLGSPRRYPAPISGGLLKFFPVGFLVSSTPPIVPGFRFAQLNLSNNSETEISLPLADAPRPGWPERIQGNEALLLADHVAYVAGSDV
jgi:hypothetical protein